MKFQKLKRKRTHELWNRKWQWITESDESFTNRKIDSFKKEFSLITEILEDTELIKHIVTPKFVEGHDTRTDLDRFEYADFIKTIKKLQKYIHIIK